MAPVQPNIRVIVRLPWNRPEEPEAVADPPPVGSTFLAFYHYLCHQYETSYLCNALSRV